MKILKTLCFLLLAATAAFAQVLPDDLFISGTVLDPNGQAQPNVTICVTVSPNIITFPPDSFCTTTDAQGWYSLLIPNGSVSGPNIPFIVTMNDPCGIIPSVQTATIDNGQGTVDLVTLDWVTCGGSITCSTNFTSTNDSTNGSWTFVANATGTAPFTYDWWVDGTSYSTQTVSHMFNGGTVGVLLTVTDANGCQSTDADTLFLNGSPTACGGYIQSFANPIGTTFEAVASGGTPPYTYFWSNGDNGQATTVGAPGVYCVNIIDATGCFFTTCDTIPDPNQGCSLSIVVNEDSLGGVLNAELIAFPSGVAPFQYQWSNGATTESIYLEDLVGLDSVCVVITDANGCVSTSCEIVGYEPNQACFVEITTTVDSTLLGVMYTLTASGSFSQYSWSNNQVGQTITVQNNSPNGEVYCVTAWDGNGCTATACDTLSPNTNNCQANYSWAIDSSLGAPLPGVQFTDLSLGNAIYWYWDFGDGATSTDQNPLHLYNGNGPFVVCLIIVTPNQQCQSTFCDTVYLGTNPGNCSAMFSNSGPTPIGYTFSADIQNSALEYYWTIDNQFVGDGYDAYSPGFTNGIHTVCLTVVDSSNGCSDTQCETITIGSPNCFGYISGQAFAGSNNQPLDEGVVYLILHDQVNNTLTAVDSMVLDSSNWFFFGPLDCGDYLVKVSATSGSQYYSNHIPTYHGNSPFWGFAQAVSLTQPNAQVTADVTLIAANNPGGPGFIGGDVTQGANKTDPGDPLSGIQVMLFDLSGNAIAYTYTDGNGEFGFGNIAYGTYQVYVEVLGVQTIPAVVTIGPDEPSIENVHILASESLISTGIEAFDFDGAISEVYPNPVGNQATINFNLEAEVTIEVSVIDLAGRAISTQTVSVGSGENTVKVNLENLKDGYYFLNIKDVDRRFSVTRKFMRVD
jgi:PKD repeat protein